MFWIIGGDALVRSLQKIHDSPLTAHSRADGALRLGRLSFLRFDFPLFVFIVGVSPSFLRRMLPSKAGWDHSANVVRFGRPVSPRDFYMGASPTDSKTSYLAGVLHRIASRTFSPPSFASRPRALVFLCFAFWPAIGPCWRSCPCRPRRALLAEPGKNLPTPGRTLSARPKFEGTLLSTMGAVANCLLGASPVLLRRPRPCPQRSIGCSVPVSQPGVGFSLVPLFPIIKLLWRLRLRAGGVRLQRDSLAVFYQVIELWNSRNGPSVRLARHERITILPRCEPRQFPSPGSLRRR